jgi:Domain of unknown function (DUF4350)
MSRRKDLVLLSVLAIAFIGGLAMIGPSRTADDALALRRFLSESGLVVRTEASPPPPPATFVLLRDVRDQEQASSLLRWARSGGKLVVADPGSLLLPLLSVEGGDRVALFGTRTLLPSCAAPETVGLAGIVADSGDLTLRSSNADAIECFSRLGGSYALLLQAGEGEVVLLGGSSTVTNELLDEGDNAVFALRLFEGGGPVVFGPPAPPGARGQSLWGLLPGPPKLVIIEIVIAAVLFALARARRLGRFPLEEPLAPIPASELVRATAGLYRRARASAFCGRLLRSSTSSRLARRLGSPHDVAADRLAELVSRSSHLPRERVERALSGPDPTTDQELMALGDELATIMRHTEGASR